MFSSVYWLRQHFRNRVFWTFAHSSNRNAEWRTVVMANFFPFSLFCFTLLKWSEGSKVHLSLSLSSFIFSFLVSFCRLLRNHYSLFLLRSFAQFVRPLLQYYSVIHPFIHTFVCVSSLFLWLSFNAFILVKTGTKRQM